MEQCLCGRNQQQRRAHGRPSRRLKEASHEPFGARALVCCLLAGKGEKERKAQLDWLRAHADAAVLREVDLLMPLIGGVERAHPLPLAEMAMPDLKALSPRQYQAFRGIVRSPAAADKRVSHFEYALHRMLVRNLSNKERLPNEIKIYRYFSSTTASSGLAERAAATALRSSLKL